MNPIRLSLSACAGLALTPVAAAAVGGGPETLALAATLGAVLLAAGVPWAARSESAPVPLLAPAGSLCAGLAISGSFVSPATAWGLALYLLLGAALLTFACLRVGPRRAQAPVTALALAALSLPYWGALPLSLLGDELALALTLHSPLPVICGTFAEVDLLRAPTLYRVFPLGQSSPYAYPSALAAWASLGVPALLLAGLGALRRLRLPRPAPAPTATLALVLLLFGAPAPAQAQLFPESRGDTGEVSIGDLVTRVNLGYYVPFLTEGEIKLSARNRTNGSRLDFDRNLDLEAEYMIPTFEVALSWENGGLLLIQYMESEWVGNIRTGEDLLVKTTTFHAGNFVDTRYRYRTIAIRGEVDIPVNEYITLQILTTQRYLWSRIRMRGTPEGSFERSTGETLAPVFGVGADVLVYNLISIYGDIQWLDFRTSLFGGEDHEYVQRYREWRAGVRLELVEHAHVMVEWYAVDTFFEIGEEKKFKQDLRGVRVQVAVLF